MRAALRVPHPFLKGFYVKISSWNPNYLEITSHIKTTVANFGYRSFCR
jgi:hypothetical protein